MSFKEVTSKGGKIYTTPGRKDKQAGWQKH